MIAEALKFLTDLGRKADQPILLEKATDAKTARYALGGEIKTIALDVPVRTHAVGSLSEIMSLATRFVSDDFAEASPVAWYDENAVVLVLDDSGHRVDTATFTLHKSQVFNTVERLAKQTVWHQAKAFVRLLRVDLVGCLDNSLLLNAVKRVRFESKASSEAENARGKSSMGRSINSEISGALEIPEEVTLHIPVYRNRNEDSRYPVRCMVEINPDDETLALVPRPDEITRVVQMAMDSIAERLSAGLPDTVPAYQGRA